MNPGLASPVAAATLPPDAVLDAAEPSVLGPAADAAWADAAPGVETSPVSAWMRHPSMVDWPGHMAGVLLVTGCNFRCPFCHNAPLLATPRGGLPWKDLDALCRKFRSHWVDAIVISGGEPTLRADLPELVRFLRDRRFHVKLDTNGSRPDRIEAVIDAVDYVAMDVKCSLDRYPSLVGYARPEAIRMSIDLIRDRAAEYEFRTTIADPIHDDAQVEAVAGLVSGSRRWILQRFEPRGELLHPECRSWLRTSPSRLHALRDRFSGCAQEVLVRGG